MPAADNIHATAQKPPRPSVRSTQPHRRVRGLAPQRRAHPHMHAGHVVGQGWQHLTPNRLNSLRNVLHIRICLQEVLRDPGAADSGRVAP